MKYMTWVVAVAGLAMGTAALAGGEWLTDFEAAKKAAVEKKVPILINFTGSDWCPWCVKLHDEVFADAVFKKFAKDNLVLFVADFPRRTKLDPSVVEQNEKLAAQYGVEGFPTIMLVDGTGKPLAQTGYRRGGAAAYVKHLQELMARK